MRPGLRQDRMGWYERWHFLHRAWRYRLRSEKAAVQFLMSRELSGKTMVDIGANIGIYCYWMHKKVGRDGAVIAFEPQAVLSTQLLALRRHFKLQRLEIVNLGLSSASGIRELRRPRAHWGGASLEPLNGDTDILQVRVTTLDEYLDRHPARPVSFIKCDVEGHEHHVFQGAKSVLTEDRPDLLFECFDVGSRDCKVLSLLNSLDYAGFCFYRGGLAPISEYRSIRHLMHKRARVDFAFVPLERIEQLFQTMHRHQSDAPPLATAHARCDG